MTINGVDHDMLIMSDLFVLAGNAIAAKSAYAVAQETCLNTSPLSMDEALSLLISAGEPAIGFDGDAESALDMAKGFAKQGCPTIIHIKQPGDDGEPLWYLMYDEKDGMIGTICHAEQDCEPVMPGRLVDYFLGEVITISRPVRGWHHSWAEVFSRHAPL